MMRLVILVLAGFMVLSMGQQHARQLEAMHTLETVGGVKSETQCSLYSFTDDQEVKRDFILCDDGSCIVDPITIEGSTTGTPAWLTYENYVGSYTLSEGILPGEGRQRIFFDGPLRKKNENE